MNTSMIIGVGVIAIVALIGASIFYSGIPQSGGSSTNTGTTATSQTETTSQTTTTGGTGSTTTTGGAVFDLSGTWKGTYSSRQSGAENAGSIELVLYKTGENTYGGKVKLTGTIDTRGYVPVSVTVSGDSFSGIVGNGVASFNGKIAGNGREISGSWTASGGQDSGSWSISRISESTTTSTPGSSTTTTKPRCTPTPPVNLRGVFNEAYTIVADVFGEENLECISQTTMMYTYQAMYKLEGYDQASYMEYYNNIVSGLQEYNATIISSSYQPSSIQVTAVINQTLGVQISIGEDHGEYYLTIQVGTSQ